MRTHAHTHTHTHTPDELLKWLEEIIKQKRQLRQRGSMLKLNYFKEFQTRAAAISPPS